MAEPLERSSHFTVSSDLATGSPTVTVSLEGEIDAAAAPAVSSELTAVIDSGCSMVRVDMSNVSFLDSSGLNALLRANLEAGTAGTSLHIDQPSDAVRRLFEMAGVRDMLISATDNHG